MCDITLVRIINPDGKIDLLRKTHSQLCELLIGANPSVRRNADFWNGNSTTTNEHGQNIKIVIESRLKQ